MYIQNKIVLSSHNIAKQLLFQKSITVIIIYQKRATLHFHFISIQKTLSAFGAGGNKFQKIIV